MNNDLAQPKRFRSVDMRQPTNEWQSIKQSHSLLMENSWLILIVSVLASCATTVSAQTDATFETFRWIVKHCFARRYVGAFQWFDARFARFECVGLGNFDSRQQRRSNH